MRLFTMNRGKDESGVSGTGDVLEGIITESGRVVVEWSTSPHSLGVYDAYEDFIYIHVDSHPANDTTIRFSDGTIDYYGDVDESD